VNEAIAAGGGFTFGGAGAGAFLGVFAIGVHLRFGGHAGSVRASGSLHCIKELARFERDLLALVAVRSMVALAESDMLMKYFCQAIDNVRLVGYTLFGVLECLMVTVLIGKYAAPALVVFSP